MSDRLPPPPSGVLVRVLERSQSLGFLGPGAVEEHVTHAEAYLAPLDECSRVLDLGSGGGVPGLALVLASDADWTLVDAMEKRCRFLEWAVAQLDVADRVEVRCGRAEDLARDPALRHRFDAVVARSFGPPAVTAECAVGFMRVGGRLVVSEPPEGDPAERRWPSEGIGRLGLRAVDVVRGGNSRLQVLAAEAPCGEDYPRRVGLPAKRPLF